MPFLCSLPTKKARQVYSGRWHQGFWFDSPYADELQCMGCAQVGIRLHASRICPLKASVLGSKFRKCVQKRIVWFRTSVWQSSCSKTYRTSSRERKSSLQLRLITLPTEQLPQRVRWLLMVKCLNLIPVSFETDSNQGSKAALARRASQRRRAALQRPPSSTAP